MGFVADVTFVWSWAFGSRVSHPQALETSFTLFEELNPVVHGFTREFFTIGQIMVVGFTEDTELVQISRAVILWRYSFWSVDVSCKRSGHSKICGGFSFRFDWFTFKLGCIVESNR